MSHTIYTTNAIILHSVPTGEADSTVWLLTEDLGLIVARAQSARKEKAKMRSFIQVGNVSQVSLVRGKQVWRMTGAEVSTYYKHQAQSNSTDTLAQATFAQLSRFVRRMTITDIQSTKELFQHMLTAWHTITIHNHKEVELHTIAEILITLGYLDASRLDKYKAKTIQKDAFVHIINNAIAASHL